jgi:ArsR family metal-binding transcriptional regulator
MTRAVVQLSGDISSAMPRISKLIEGCAYNPEANLMGFRFKNMTITVEPKQINISHIEDETMIQTTIDWFVNCANSTEKSE